jgi:hypothetical protein
VNYPGTRKSLSGNLGSRDRIKRKERNPNTRAKEHRS